MKYSVIVSESENLDTISLHPKFRVLTRVPNQWTRLMGSS